MQNKVQTAGGKMRQYGLSWFINGKWGPRGSELALKRSTDPLVRNVLLDLQIVAKTDFMRKYEVLGLRHFSPIKATQG